MFIIDDIVAIYSVLRTAWTAFKAIKVVASALAIAGKVIKILSVIKFLGSLQKPKLPSSGSELELQIDPNAGLPIAIGERLTYGNLAFRKTWTGGKNNAEPNQVLGMVKVLSTGGPIESIEYCQLGDNKVTSFSGNPLTSLVSVTGCSPDTGKVYTYEGHYHQRWSKGDLTGSVPSLAYFNAGGWTGYDSSSSLTGFAWVAEVLKKNDTTFPQGLPSAGYLIKGLKWYDWRKDSTVAGGSGSHRWDDPDTYEYSSNAYVVTYGIIRGRLEKTAGGLVVKSWGLHVNPALIDTESFVEAANIADALGWNVNAIGNTTDTPKAFIDKLLQCSGGYLISQAAKITAFINAPKTAVYNITDEDIIGEISIDTSTSYRDRINSVIPVYPEPALQFEDYYAEAITVEKYQDEDGELKETELQLDYCTDIDQATQLAALELVNSREFLSYTTLCKPRTMSIRTGQTVNITSVGLNIATQKCLVIGRELDLGSMTVKLKLRSEDDAKYDWIQGLSPTAPDTKAIVGLEWANPSAPDADVFTVASFVDDDQIPAFLISANLGDIPDAITSIGFDYRLSTDTAWSLSGSLAVHDYDHVAYAIRGLKPVSYYDIAIYYVNSFGVVTDRTIFTNRLTSKLVSNDTQNVGGVNAGDLVNTATQAYSLGWDAVNNAAALAAELTAQAVAFADGLAAEASDRANAISVSAASLQANIDALEGQIDAASLAPAWSNTVTYTIGDIVTDNGSLWKSIANGTNHEPPSTYWVKIGDYDSVSGAIDGLATQVNLTNATVTALGNTVTATASDLTGVKARLTNAETKANTQATAITALQTNATLTATTVASQANAITAVQANVTSLQANGTGYSSAISALQTNSISQGANIATQASQITALQSNTAGFASAINGLQTNSVTQGNTISTQAGQITSLQSSLANAGSENLAYNPSLDAGTPTANGYTAGSGGTGGTVATPSKVSSSLLVSGDAQRITFTGLSTTAFGAYSCNNDSTRPVVKSTTDYTFSFYVKGTAGLSASPCIQYYQADGTTSESNNIATPVLLTGGWQRLPYTVKTVSAGYARIFVRIYGTASLTSGYVELDCFQFEEGNVATAWRDNTSILAENQTAQSTAIGAIQALTIQQGSNIRTQADALTSLTSALSDTGGQNLLFNPSLSGSGTYADGWNCSGPSGGTGVYTLPTSTRTLSNNMQQQVYTGLSTTLFGNFYTSAVIAYYAPIVAGTYYTLSVWVKATAGLSIRPYIFWHDSTGTQVGNNGVAVTATGAWQQITVAAVAPANMFYARPQLRTYGTATLTAGTVQWECVQLEQGQIATAWRDNPSASLAAQSAAIGALQTLTTQQGSNISTQAASITSLQSQVNDSGGDNLIYNPSFESGTATVVAEGWQASGTYTSAVVQNNVSYDGNQGKSQRLNVSALTTSVYADIKTAAGVEAQVTAGKTYTLSAYVNATAGFQHRMYIQFRDSAGTVLSTPATGLINRVSGWNRLSVSGVAPSGAVDAVIYLRTFGDDASAQSGTIYWDMVQLEVGSLTAFRDNIRASTAALATQATAITSVQTLATQTNSTATATASSLSTLSTTVGGHTASISSLNTTTNGLSARASLTVSAGGAVTGFSITSNASAGSTFAIQADKFILTSGTKAVSPFSVDTVNNKVIATNLVVDTLQIKDGALTNYGYYQNAIAYNVDTASEVTFGSVTITTSGGWVDLAASIVGYSGLSSGYTYYDMCLYRGSTVLITIPRSLCLFTYPGIPSQGASGIYVDTPAAGTYTYSWRGTVSSYSSGRSTNITYRSLRAVEFKR